MGLRVREAMSLEGVNRITLVAGESGLDREILNVTVVEVPDSAKWLKGGEFLITAFFNFRQALSSQLSFMEAAAQRGSAALAILSHPEGYIGDLPAVLKEHANQLSLPLFTIPNEVAYVDITLPIYGEIVNRQARELKYALDAHTQMTEVVFAGKQLPDLVQLMARLMRNPVMVLDRWGRALATAEPCGPLSTRLFMEAMDSPATVVVEIENGLDSAGRANFDALNNNFSVQSPVFMRRPIRAGRFRYGQVIVWLKNFPLTGLHMMALEQACTVLSFYMEKERVVQEVKSHLHRDLLDELIAGVEPDLIDSRFRAAGWTLENKKAVLIIKTEPVPGRAARSAPDPEGVTADDYHVIRDVLERDSSGHMAIRRGNSIVVLVQAESGASRERIKKNCVNLAKALISAFAGKNSEVLVGIGNPCKEPGGLRRSYEEARNSLALGKKVSPGQRVLQIDDLAGYDYLSRSSRSGELAEFAEKVLGPLNRYDEENNCQLVRALDVFISCGGNISAAARQLYIHRNTLRNRLEKVKEVLGFDPFLNPHRLNIQMALAVRRLLL